MDSGNSSFYADLPCPDFAIHEIMGNETLFHTLPKDWHIIVSDIKDSTKALAEGKHTLVNLIATGSIIAALNLAREQEISIPFFFGGDGATLIVPEILLEPTLAALQEHKENSLENFDLYLRVGSMPVSEVYAKKHNLLISKAHINALFSIPLVLGDGLKFAEDQIKKYDPLAEDKPEKEEVYLNLAGMECRWNKVTPPQDNQEVLSLLVEAMDEKRQGAIFQQVLHEIESIFGNQGKRNPISVRRLRLDASTRKIRMEMKVRLGKSSLSYLLENWLVTLFGFIYFSLYKNGKRYLDSLVELSDTLVIDGRINTVITGTAAQKEALIQKLDEIEKSGDILYGIYQSQQSVMSCYVTDRQDQHIHFIDGAEGGYTQAANMLKQKIRDKRT